MRLVPLQIAESDGGGVDAVGDVAEKPAGRAAVAGPVIEGQGELGDLAVIDHVHVDDRRGPEPVHRRIGDCRGGQDGPDVLPRSASIARFQEASLTGSAPALMTVKNRPERPKWRRYLGSPPFAPILILAR